MKKLILAFTILISAICFAVGSHYVLYKTNKELKEPIKESNVSNIVKKPVFATTYYVRMDGLDSHSGTSNTSGGAFLTVTHALSVATTSGDIVHVVAGNYTETGQMFLAPGVSLEGDGVTSVLKTNWNTSFYGFLACLSTEGTNGNQSISYLKFDGNNLATPRGIDIEGRSNVKVHHCTIVDFKEEGIIFNGTNGFTGFAPSIYATGNEFHDNILTNCSRYAGFGTGCLGIGGQIGMLIYNNTITQNLRTSPEQIGWPIKYFNEGYLKGVHIYNNTITKARANGEGWNFALELFNNSGVEIDHNTIQGSLDFNFQNITGYSYSVSVHDNLIGETSYNSHTEDGIIVEYPITGLIVKNNKFTYLSTGVTFYTRDSALIKDITIEHNLFAHFSNSAEGVGGFVGGFGNGASTYYIDGLTVINNTMVGGQLVSGNRIYNGVGLGAPTGGYLKNVRVQNNYMDNISNNVFNAGGTVTPDSVYFTNNTVRNITYNGTPQWTNTPTHYTNVNNNAFAASFIDTLDYKIGSSSLLKDAGIIIVGHSYIGTAPDIGYFEVGSAFNTPPVVSAGADSTVELPRTTVTLIGTATDGDGSVVSHFWRQISGTTATITDSTALTTVVTLLNTTGVRTFELRATDDSGAVVRDTVVITVNAAVPPTVTATNPASGAMGVAIGTTVVITFSETMKSSTLNSTNVFVTGKVGTVTFGSNFATITFGTALAYNTTYTVNVQSVQDAAGNAIASPYTYTFTTGIAPIDSKTFTIKGLKKFN